MENKEWEVPEELVESQTKAEALESISKLYVKLPLGYKKALRSSQECYRLRDEFWVKIFKIYPDTKGKSLTFFKNERVIREKLI